MGFFSRAALLRSLERRILPLDELDWDPCTNTVIERRTQDVEPILESNVRLQNDSDGFSPGREMRHIARVPVVVAHQWMREGINPFDPNDPRLLRKLRDPEWRKLRTSSGGI